MARDYILRLIEQLATLLAGLLARRKAGQTIEAREDLENLCVRTCGFTLNEIKLLAPEEVARLMQRAGAMQIFRSFAVAEMLLLDAQWQGEEGAKDSLIPNYVHAFCLIADSFDALTKEDQKHYEPKLRDLGAKLGDLLNHPYLRERWEKFSSQAPNV